MLKLILSLALCASTISQAAYKLEYHTKAVTYFDTYVTIKQAGKNDRMVILWDMHTELIKHDDVECEELPERLVAALKEVDETGKAYRIYTAFKDPKE